MGCSKNSVNHTCNLLPRTQAEGVGSATLPGRRLAKALALGFLAAILGLSLSWLSDKDQRRAHDANIAVSVSRIDYCSNKDPVLDAVLARTTKQSVCAHRQTP